MIYLHMVILLLTGYLVYLKKLKRKQLLVMVGAVLIAIVHLQLMQPELASFQRDDYGEEDRTETVYVSQDSKTWQTLDVVIPALRYTKEELDTLSKQAMKRAGEILLGDNTSLDCIQEDVCLVDAIEGLPFEISWSTSDMEIITAEGQVLNDNLATSVDCVLIAEFLCQDVTYQGEYVLTVHPAKLTEQEIKQKELQALIADTVKSQERDIEVNLPEQLGDFWIYKTLCNEWESLLWPGIAIFLYLYSNAKKEEKQRQEKKRWKDALLQAYPYFVNQLVIYLGAGMTVKGTMEQIRKSVCHTEKLHLQVLCEEMNSMFYEMENGVSEKQAYHNFARRLSDCGYNKVMAIVVQNLTLGSKGLLGRLEELEEEAFVKQKEFKKTKGEEASTKLLLPMVVLLGVTMLLIVVPGFLGMG